MSVSPKRIIKFQNIYALFARSQVTFAEVGCSGPGSDTAGRVAWEKHLSDEEVQKFVELKFIDHGGWLSNLP